MWKPRAFLRPAPYIDGIDYAELNAIPEEELAAMMAESLWKGKTIGRNLEPIDLEAADEGFLSKTTGLPIKHLFTGPEKMRVHSDCYLIDQLEQGNPVKAESYDLERARKSGLMIVRGTVFNNVELEHGEVWCPVIINIEGELPTPDNLSAFDVMLAFNRYTIERQAQG